LIVLALAEEMYEDLHRSGGIVEERGLRLKDDTTGHHGPGSADKFLEDIVA
jgi:hypothetical protein